MALVNKAAALPQDLQSLDQHLAAGVSQVHVFGPHQDQGFRALAQVCHPDKFAPGTPEAARATRLFKLLEAWRDPPHPVVKSGTREYQPIYQLGTGDLADVWFAVSQDHQYVVKIPRVLTCNPLLAKEREVLEQLHQRGTATIYPRYLPRPIESFVVDKRRINVTAYQPGYLTVDEIVAQYPQGLDPRHIAWMLRRVLEALGFTHQFGWIHGAVLPPHLLFHPVTHGLLLLGWVGAEQKGRPIKTAPQRYKGWYPPEALAKGASSPALDIWLASKTAVALACGTGAPVLDRNRHPQWLRQFVEACCLESPTMRLGNAFEAHKILGDALFRQYGKPRYMKLDVV